MKNINEILETVNVNYEASMEEAWAIVAAHEEAVKSGNAKLKKRIDAVLTDINYHSLSWLLEWREYGLAFDWIREVLCSQKLDGNMRCLVFYNGEKLAETTKKYSTRGIVDFFNRIRNVEFYKRFDDLGDFFREAEKLKVEVYRMAA
jgi:hypothetical protein